MIVESTSSNPYWGGWIEIETNERGARLRWEGSDEWIEVEWYEVLLINGNLPERIKDELDWLKDWAKQKGYEEAFAEMEQEVRRRAREAIELWRKGEIAL